MSYSYTITKHAISHLRRRKCLNAQEQQKKDGAEEHGTLLSQHYPLHIHCFLEGSKCEMKSSLDVIKNGASDILK